jgi:4-hydroxy-tetrahydrodipicolinate reductase
MLARSPTPNPKPPTPIQVAICGVHGRMGEEMVDGLTREGGITVIGGCDPRVGDDGITPTAFPTARSLAELLDMVKADVAVDFTTAEAARGNARVALEHAVPIVIGTTGLNDDDFRTIDDLAHEAGVGALVAPNFAIGANLLMQFARMASKFFDSAEIIETHHDGKIDSPSGTALLMAKGMREGRDTPFAGDNVTKHVVEHTRGGMANDVHIHSLRMQGFVASHQVIFGGPGQSLTIRHDSIGRDSFVPGVAFAVKHIREHVGLVYGLDALMKIEGT